MKAVHWKPHITVHVLGAISATYSNSKYWGKTTDRPPYREGNTIKVDIIDGDGSHRAITLSRLQIGGAA